MAMLSASRALQLPPPASSVDFPSSGEPPPSAFVRPGYLPAFRRMSMPTAPSLIQRHSVGSVQSFESLPEDAPPMMPLVMKNVNKKSGAGAVAPHNARRSSQWKLRPIDEGRELKRRKIVAEFFETERSYVAGLNLIHSHFLEGIIASLDTAHPLLERPELTSVFSNFIDIWNLHCAFFASLSAMLEPAGAPPPLSPLLLAHFPYLSLYSPFVTAFPGAMASLGQLQATRPAFAAYVARREADERCGSLKLRDWLLTIVQRCPRYLLLLKDLIGCTDSEDAEHASLTAVHSLVSKITNTLNTSLHTHAQTLALLALQRNTANLPFQLITPGRNLVKRGALLQLEGAADPKERELLLFSDCLLWLAAADGLDGQLAEKWDWSATRPAPPLPAPEPEAAPTLASPTRPRMARQRSKSDAALPTLSTRAVAQASRASEGGQPPAPSPKRSVFPKAKRRPRAAGGGAEERWVFKGRAELIDIEVTAASRDAGDERRFEVLSPEASFAVYANSEEERDEWVAAIRTAKASLLISLNAMHPNSTLTASGSTAHVRRTLQALPHAPGDAGAPRRGRVEHFVPPIWIPDAKTAACMRCGKTFGWRRRRHHCRLCGRCVCSACSGMTFYICETSAKASNKAARACDTCYESVFPLLEGESTGAEPLLPASESQSSHLTLSGFPAWQSISMPVLGLPARQASALLAVDLGRPGPSRHVSEADDGGGSPRVKIRAPSRPRSYVQILEDFHMQLGTSPPPPPPRLSSAQSGESGTEPPSASDADADEDEADPTPSLSDDHASALARGGSPRRKEDTVRRHKRFSVPAMALQTTPVTAKAAGAKRFSLVLGRGGDGGAGASVRARAAGRRPLDNGPAATKLQELLGRRKPQDAR